MPDPNNTPAVIVAHGPYEDAIIELIRLATAVLNSVPEDVRAELAKLYLEDFKQWRAFWAALRGGLGDALKESAK